MFTERRLKALEKRFEKLDTEVWDILKVLKDFSGSLSRSAELEAQHCADWEKRNDLFPMMKKLHSLTRPARGPGRPAACR